MSLDAPDRRLYRMTPHAEAALRRSGDRIVITGASGWLGSATLDLLANALGEGFAERVHCFGSAARTLSPRPGVMIAQRPLTELADLPSEPSLLLHLAFLTKDKVEGMPASDYEAANAALSRTVLNALTAIGTQAVFVASSGAARSADDPSARHDMRLYGALKKRDEDDFAVWAETTGRTAVVTRIFNVAGPHINKHQDYALAAFIRSAMLGETIRVNAPHRVIRGYVAIRELMSLVFLLLVERSRGVVRFDTGGAAMELADVARAVAGVMAAGAIEQAEIVSDRIDHYVGDPTEYDRLRAAYGVGSVPLAEQIRETADSFVAV